MRDLSRFINSSESLAGLMGRANKPLLAVLGPFNSGKSTLINNLLGLQISPVGVVPQTSGLIYFDYGSSFSALAGDRRGKEVFPQPSGLYSFLAREKSAGGRVEIQLPSPILRKCRLVDTPGIDTLDEDLLWIPEQVAREADKIIYLFHQRGIDQGSRLFLYKLAAIRKSKNLDDISFWLNCNLGKSDGASLEITRSALREIFLCPVRVGAINTLTRENIENLRLFIEVQLAKEIFRRSAGELKKIDNELPRKLKKISSIKNDALFLDEFWQIQQVTRTILEAGRVIHTAPSFVRELDHKLAEMSSANLMTGGKKMDGAAYRPRPQTIRENRRALQGIIGQLAGDPVIKEYIDLPGLARISASVASERFTVAVTGGFSTGKSTFINTLLKDDLLPVSDGPTTSAVTRVAHGGSKKAIVRAPLQTTVQLCERVGDKAVLNKAALEALERWLKADGPNISLLEVSAGGDFVVVDARQMAGSLKKTRELFAAGAFARSSPMAPPATFRRIPVKALRGSRTPQKIRVTFKNPGAREYDLAEPGELPAFREALGQDWGLKVEEAEIQHPARFLELVSLVDTPGLDWIHRHHQERIRSSIKDSDACLVFFNGKHVLSNIERDNFASFFQFKDIFKDNEKIFYVISFADTLTPSQREAVYNYMMNYLKKSTRPKIFMISCLKGPAGGESGIKSLLKGLEESILKHRGREFYLGGLNDIYGILEAATQKINNILRPGQPAPVEKKALRAALEGLREYRLQIKTARNTVYDTGRFSISGKRETFR